MYATNNGDEVFTDNQPYSTSAGWKNPRGNVTLEICIFLHKLDLLIYHKNFCENSLFTLLLQKLVISIGFSNFPIGT